MKLYGHKEFEIRREVTPSAISDHGRGHLPHRPTTNSERLLSANPDSDSLPLSLLLSLPLSVYISLLLSVSFPTPFYTPMTTYSRPNKTHRPSLTTMKLS